LQEARKNRVQVESAPQRLFGTLAINKEDLPEEELSAMRAEAETYVAGLVAGAQRRVIFVDPDFGLREMQKYALRVMRDGVDIKILTGARCMRAGPRPGDSASEAVADLDDVATPSVEHGVAAQTASTPAEQTWSRCARGIRDARFAQSPLSRPFPADRRHRVGIRTVVQ
jgi:hypothetical protein